MVKMVFGYLSI